MIKTENYIMVRSWEENPFSKEQQMEYGVFLLCINGHVVVHSNSKRFELTPGHIVISPVYSTYKISDISDDFEGYLVGFNDEFFKRLKLPNSVEYLIIWNNSPMLRLAENDYHRMKCMIKHLDLENYQHNEFVAAMNNSTLLAVSYNIIFAYLADTHNKGEFKSHNETIFRNFVLHMYGNCKQERSVMYYAEKQHITPRHLNRVVKEICGKSPSDMIANTTIEQIKMSVKYENHSISQLYIEFCFSQPSALHTYFKKHTGMTITEYRDSLQNNNSIPSKDK